MNCLTARQMLDLSRSDEPAADDHAAGYGDSSTFAEAARHVEDCPACQTAVRRQRQFDHKVGVMIREAPVPADLKDRLLARLEVEARGATNDRAEAAVSPAAASPAVTPTVTPSVATPAPVAAPAVSSRAGSRRRWLGAVTLAAACVAAGIGAWSIWPVPPSINPDDVAAELAIGTLTPDDLGEFTRFASGQAAKVPETMKSARLVLAPRRLDERDVAVYFFAFSAGGPLDGRLAVIPKHRVVAGEIPPAASFLAPPAVVTYKSGFCVTAWVEGEFVYVCCLKGGENKLHRLLPNRAMPI